MRRGVALVGGALLGGCALIAGFEAPIYATGDDDGSPPVDVDAADARSSDAAGDVTDAFACSDAYDFCDDFDGVRTLQGEWTSTERYNTGRVALDAGAFVTEIWEAQGGPAPQVAALGYTRPWSTTDAGGRRRVMAAFRGRIDRCPSPCTLTTGITFFMGNVVPSPDTLHFEICSEDMGCYVRLAEIFHNDAGQVSYRYGGKIDVPTNTWLDFHLVIDERPTLADPLRATLTVGALPAPMQLGSGAPPPPTFGLHFGLGNGNSFGNDAGMSYDDFRLTYSR